MMDVDVRVAAGRDRTKLVGLIGAFRDELGQSSPSDQALHRFLSDRLGRSNRLVFVLATAATDAVGYAHFTTHDAWWVDGPAMALHDLYVKSVHRHAGIGTDLLTAVISMGRERGVHGITLTTNEHNVGAQRLYSSMGFQPSTEARWNGGREEAWTLRLDDDPGPI